MGTELKVELLEPGADLEVVHDLTRALRLELLELDVDSVSPATAGPTPAGSRGVDIAVIGALLVQVASSMDAVSSLVTTVRSWLHRALRRGAR